MRVRTLLVAVALGLAALSGCQKLSHEQTLSLDAHSSKALEFGAPRYNQKVTVTVKPTSGPVSAYLCTLDNKQQVEDALMRDKEPDAATVLGSAKGQGTDAEITFEATVPKQTEFALVVNNPGKTKNEVTAKVVGR
jgi:hypothetical protein